MRARTDELTHFLAIEKNKLGRGNETVVVDVVLPRGKSHSYT
jgi:hypothetical protein